MRCPRCSFLTFNARTLVNHCTTCTGLAAVPAVPLDLPPPGNTAQSNRPRDTFTNEMLTTYGLIINTVHHILICMQCGCSISHLRVRAHFLLEHSGLKLPQDLDSQFATMLATEYPHLVYPPNPPTLPVHSLYGLKPPLALYRVCHICHRGYKGRHADNPSLPASKAFGAHNCVPGQPNPPDRTWFESDVQIFDRRPHSHYFAVTSPPPITVPPNPWTLYEARMNSRPKKEGKQSVPNNFRVLDQFLRKEGWLQHIEGHDVVKLRNLIALDTEDAQLPNLVKHCEAYLHHHQSALQSYHARRLISTRPRYVTASIFVVVLLITPLDSAE